MHASFVWGRSRAGLHTWTFQTTPCRTEGMEGSEKHAQQAQATGGLAARNFWSQKHRVVNKEEEMQNPRVGHTVLCSHHPIPTFEEHRH